MVKEIGNNLFLFFHIKFLQCGMNNEYKIIYFSFCLRASYLHKTKWLATNYLVLWRWKNKDDHESTDIIFYEAKTTSDYNYTRKTSKKTKYKYLSIFRFFFKLFSILLIFFFNQYTILTNTMTCPHTKNINI